MQLSICWAERSKSNSAARAASGKPELQSAVSSDSSAPNKRRAKRPPRLPTNSSRKYGVITEGERSEKWAESHASDLSLNLVSTEPFLLLEDTRHANRPDRIDRQLPFRGQNFKLAQLRNDLFGLGGQEPTRVQTFCP
jgi:hypothetical protein